VDPLVEFPEREKVEEALKRAELVAIFHPFSIESSRYGDILVPVALPFEYEGSFTNLEGRVQFFERVIEPPDGIFPGYGLLSQLLSRLGVKVPEEPKEIFERIRSESEPYRNIKYGKEGVRELPYPEEIPTMRGIRQEFETPLASYPMELKMGEPIPGEERKKGEDLRLFTGYHIYRTPLVRESELGRSVFYDADVEISREDAEKLGLEPGEKIAIEGIEVTFRVNEDLKEGEIRVLWPFYTPINRLLGPNGTGRAKIEVRAGKE
jgi:predicted molibdopterin-dependent oxidoreductase YjgC